MANWTRADLGNRALEALGVKSPSQSANAQETARATEAVDQVYERLRKRHHVTFATSAIPPWAQDSMRDMVAQQLLAVFGVSQQRAAVIQAMAAKAKADFAEQVASKKPPIPVEINFF